jgi:uncharacterized membrane protein
METATLTYLVSQLAYQAPVMFVYLIGMALGLAFFRRCAVPAMLCFVGCSLLLLTTLVVAGMQAEILQQQSGGALPPYRIGQLMSAVGIAGSGVRAVGFGLLISGVFVSRKSVNGRPA